MYYIHNHTRSGTLSLEEGTSCKSCKRQIQGTYLLGTGEVSRIQYLLIILLSHVSCMLYTCGDISASPLIHGVVGVGLVVGLGPHLDPQLYLLPAAVCHHP